SNPLFNETLKTSLNQRGERPGIASATRWSMSGAGASGEPTDEVHMGRAVRAPGHASRNRHRKMPYTVRSKRCGAPCQSSTPRLARIAHQTSTAMSQENVTIVPTFFTRRQVGTGTLVPAAAARALPQSTAVETTPQGNRERSVNVQILYFRFALNCLRLKPLWLRNACYCPCNTGSG